jgi:hypothetical protein
MAIAPPDLMECVPKSPFLTPSLSHPMASADALIASIISLLVMCSIRLFHHTADTGVLSSTHGELLIRLTTVAHNRILGIGLGVLCSIV